MPTETDEASVHPIGLVRRIGYAFIGLLAGDVAIVGYLLITSLWALVRFRSFGHPVSHILIGYAGLILIYGIFSLIGWVVVLPGVLPSSCAARHCGQPVTRNL